MLLNLPDNVKLAITKALRSDMSTNAVAKQFHKSVNSIRCYRNAFCPDLLITRTVKSYASIYRQYCDLRNDIPKLKDICRYIGITHNTLNLCRCYYEYESEPWLIKFNTENNIKTERPVLCEPALFEESAFVSKIKLSELPGEVVSIPELKSTGQKVQFPTLPASESSDRTEVRVQVKGSKIAFAVDNAALVSTVVGIIKGLYV